MICINQFMRLDKLRFDILFVDITYYMELAFSLFLEEDDDEGLI